MAKRTKRSNRGARARPERQQDPRLTAEEVTAIDGVPVQGIWAVAITRVRLSGGRVMSLHAPQPVAYNLVEARRLLIPGVRRRRRIVGNLTRRDDDTWGPTDSKAPLDALSDLATAVVLSFTAVEALANHSIGQLHDDAVVTVERNGEAVAFSKDRMVWLKIREKFDHVIPLLTGQPTITGRAEWGRFVKIKRLRDELIHDIGSGREADPDRPSVYGRLMAGAADRCVPVAIDVINAARPEFLPDHVLRALRMPDA